MKVPLLDVLARLKEIDGTAHGKVASSRLKAAILSEVERMKSAPAGTKKPSKNLVEARRRAGAVAGGDGVAVGTNPHRGEIPGTVTKVKKSVSLGDSVASLGDIDQRASTV